MYVMSDPFLKLYKDKTDRQQRVGEWVINNIQPYLDHKNLDTVDLEIGCGHGHWLSSYSTIEQSKAFVGIDLITKRIEKSESKKSKRQLPNIFFYKAEANEFVEYAGLTIENTYIMYPDPWPKFKHNKRRLIQLPFLKLLASKTSQSGKLFFMTDHQGYFDWSKDMINESDFWKLSNEPWPHDDTSYFREILPENQFFSAVRL